MGLELQVTVGHLPWVLGTKFRSSVRAGCTVNHCVISLAQSVTFGALCPLKLDQSFSSSPRTSFFIYTTGGPSIKVVDPLTY